MGWGARPGTGFASLSSGEKSRERFESSDEQRRRIVQGVLPPDSFLNLLRPSSILLLAASRYLHAKRDLVLTSVGDLKGSPNALRGTTVPNFQHTCFENERHVGR